MPNAFGVLSPNLTYSKPSWVDSEFLQKVMGWGKFVYPEIAQGRILNTNLLFRNQGTKICILSQGNTKSKDILILINNRENWKQERVCSLKDRLVVDFID